MQLMPQVGKLLNSLRQGVIVTGADGLIIDANDAAASILEELGIRIILGLPFAGLGFSRDIETAVSQSARGQSYYEKQSLLNGKKYLHWDSVPYTESDGEIAGAIFVFEDVTAILSRAQQKSEWERLVTAGEMAAGLAHEIRNPLAAARGALQLFEIADSDEQRQKTLARFSEELDRINDMLTDFVNFTKLPGADNLNPLNLADVINEIAPLIKSEAELYNVVLRISPGNAPKVWVLGNGSSLRQVFLSIVNNALEAMPLGGNLMISLGKDHSRVWVEFKDNGHGIPLEHQTNIFKPFFTTKVGGTGLGLAVSQRAINCMDGDIKVLSTPGAGTVVAVSLPILRGKGGIIFE